MKYIFQAEQSGAKGKHNYDIRKIFIKMGWTLSLNFNNEKNSITFFTKTIIYKNSYIIFERTFNLFWY